MNHQDPRASKLPKNPIAQRQRRKFGAIAWAAFLLTMASPLLLAEEPVSVEPQWSEGDTFDAIRYEDQFGNIQILSSSVQNVVFLADMDAKDSLHEVLQSRGDEYLKSKNAVIIADIHKMPYLIGVMFALPAMRDYSYTLHLIRTAGPGDRFPKKPGQMTLLRLNDRKIQSIDIYQSGNSLIEALEAR